MTAAHSSRPASTSTASSWIGRTSPARWWSSARTPGREIGRMHSTRGSDIVRREGLAGVAAVRPGWRVLALVLGSTVVAGCLGAPLIEDRWTRVDLLSANLAANQTIAPGAVQPVTMATTITYRSILTGFAVAELRASSATTAGSVLLGPNAPRE